MSFTRTICQVFIPVMTYCSIAMTSRKGFRSSHWFVLTFVLKQPIQTASHLWFCERLTNTSTCARMHIEEETLICLLLTSALWVNDVIEDHTCHQVSIELLRGIICCLSMHLMEQLQHKALLIQWHLMASWEVVVGRTFCCQLIVST